MFPLEAPYRQGLGADRRLGVPLLRPVRLVEGGTLREADIRAILNGARWPARNPNENIADLKAQLAANMRGGCARLR